MTASVTADVVVVGLGAVGSAVLHHLAAAGAKVTGIDRYRPPHTHGSSHGSTRITRLAIGEGDEYVPIVRRSHILWRELEEATGEALMTTTGGLIIASYASDQMLYHGQKGFFEQTVSAADRFGIAHELLDAKEVSYRYPAFAASDDERGYWERDAGVLFPERCVAAQLQAASSNGADTRLGQTVQRVETHAGSDGVTITTNEASFVAAHVVMATGAWLPGMLNPNLAALFTVQRQVLHWFAPLRRDLYAPDQCPVFIWMHGADGASFYGFPMIDSYAGVKVATEQVEQSTTPETVCRAVTAEETEHTFEFHVRERLRSLSGRSVMDATCMYTMTANGRFVVDRHPEIPQITIASACSGHGFKHSAAIGEAIAHQVLGHKTLFDMTPFETLSHAGG